MINEICKNCGTKFLKTHVNSKYCSAECSEEISKETQKKYQQSKKGKEAIKRFNDKIKNDPKKYKEKLEGHKKWLKKLNTRNFKDKNGNLLTNQQVRRLKKK